MKAHPAISFIGRAATNLEKTVPKITPIAAEQISPNAEARKICHGL